ncbi:metalloregulator ArsR/SmtB family transcription factor [Methylobacterium indicum]|uniref:metalloregulator ArsR/SmtB family transcription factor n=1 Tax=Methylobacterium indicum TaxID=1775910 RepID=UPI001FCDF6D6|nr:metalloregulator ArsR/SmtB family transcription factor [Methylobacterium indicum]
MTDGLQVMAEALVSPVRRKILAYLSAGPLSAGEIAARFEISKPSLSGHLSILSAAGLIVGARHGNRIEYSLVEDSLVNKLGALVQEVCPVAGPLRREARRKAVRRDRSPDDATSDEPQAG